MRRLTRTSDSFERFPGFGFKKHGDGWKFTPSDRWKHGRLYIEGVTGTIRRRGKAGTIPEDQEPRTCDLLHRDFEHRITKSIVDDHALLSTEELDVKTMTASAKGGNDATHVRTVDRRGLRDFSRDLRRRGGDAAA